MTFDYYKYIPRHITEEHVRNLPRPLKVEEDPRSLTDEQFAEISGLTIETIREFVREGMPCKQNGTFDFHICNEWWRKQKLPPMPISELELAKEFLEDILADGGKPAKAVYADAKVNDFTERTIDRAKKELGIMSKKTGTTWTWELPSAD